MSSSVRSCSSNSRPRSSSRSRSSSKKPAAKPAFQGAKFDADGNCIYHESVLMAEQVKQDGKLMWMELKMNCPKCASELHKSRRVTSLGGAGKVKKGKTQLHGTSNQFAQDTSRRGRHMDKEFSTPFDEKGRCHHHPQVQMASKKVRGGWKILMSACPKCIEARYDEETGKGGGGDDASVASGGSRSSRRSASSRRSITSRTAPVAPGVRYDKNGCCTRHPHMQIAKKKLLGGWKELRDCPKCVDPNYDDLNDTASFSSRTSRRSTSSRRSAKSNSSRKGGTKTSRYAALPFDDEGYCHAHPGTRLAKKKTLGGWKVLHDICPDCAHEAGSDAGSRASSRRSRRSGTGRFYYEESSNAGGGSEAASSAQPGESSAASSKRSSRSGGKNRKKKIRVKDMKFKDENGKEGRYSGDVDEDHNPHGQGKIKYKDGTTFIGVWNEGSQAHGKTTKSSSSSSSKNNASGGSTSTSGKKSGSSKSDWARRESGGKSSNAGGSGAKTVRKMKWMDYYGDPGEYTGEVDSSNMPNGRGAMKYDHGLIQEGLWAKGQFVEGSDVLDSNNYNGKSGGAGSQQRSGQRSSQQTPPKNRSSRQKSVRSSSERRMDP
eukprot:CAMPEP_0171398204 /NCGR_PEP_ID=MMETSP0880-20121228/5762_1 /TAXON_ID=67004 /ORGANISM="Thalassiosira weissflogii, Strain CCMP1336" /LENGTH=602 /DNA_ID=CAMNT_0011912151 /DNA_START=141 /DNA_END=1949 /DNA_ORIENTATION=+